MFEVWEKDGKIQRQRMIEMQRRAWWCLCVCAAGFQDASLSDVFIFNLERSQSEPTLCLFCPRGVKILKGINGDEWWEESRHGNHGAGMRDGDGVVGGETDERWR